jgi:hypothetical protein
MAAMDRKKGSKRSPRVKSASTERVRRLIERMRGKADTRLTTDQIMRLTRDRRQ